MKTTTSILITICIIAAIILFHCCILFKIIPYNITWGGRLNNDSEMYVFETVSIVVNLIFMLVLLIKGAFIKAVIPIRAVNIILWIFTALFALNTIGNVFAKTTFEKYMALVTAAFAILLWMILTKNETATNKL